MTRDDFSKLVTNLHRRLYMYAYRILKDQAGAEDAVQEVFLKLWKMNKVLEEYKSIDALATTMVKNQCIDHLRRIRHPEGSGFEGIAFRQTRELSPYDLLERNETMYILDLIIRNLPENFRVLVRMRDIDGYSYEEIAEKTGLNINTLRVNLSRARKKVKAEFIKYNNERRSDQETAGEVL